jgi:AbrB family looped-hinge helix DNA binding protein
MRVKIDGAGRVTLPKAVRDRLGLHGGGELEMQETAEGVALRTVQTEPSMIKKQGFWIHTGKIPPGYDILKAIDEDREERMRRAWGSDVWL